MSAPKSSRGGSTTRRSRRVDPQDEWSANPYNVADPRHDEHDEIVKRAQREGIMDRIGKDLVKDMRTCDFTKDALCNSTAVSGAVSRREGGSTVRSVPVMHHPYPSNLKEPESHVEGTVEIPNLTRHVAMQGGALSWSCCRDGSVIVQNGFTSEHITTFNVSDAIEIDDNEMAENERSLKAEARAHRQLGITSKVTAESETPYKSKRQKLYAVTASALGDAPYAAMLLNNDVLRVYDLITLSPVVEMPLTAQECMPGAAPEDAEAARLQAEANEKHKKHKKSKGPIPEDPFSVILPLDTHSSPILFCVVRKNSAVVMTLTFPSDRKSRPKLQILRERGYGKLKLTFVSACTDDAKSIIYAGDDQGNLWWIDLEDLLVIDSVPVVPPPASLAAKRQVGVDFATAVGAYRDWVVAGTAKGRVCAYLKQSFGEKPMLVLDEEVEGQGAVVCVAADQRMNGVWCVYEGGHIACWSLKNYELQFSTTVPVPSVVKACAVLPHTIASKMWTITTSGINSVFMTESNMPQEQMTAAMERMEEVLTSQISISRDKEAEIAVAEGTLVTRLQKAITSMEAASQQVTLRTYYYSWINYKTRAVAQRNRFIAAECMGELCNRHLMRLTYLRLNNYMNMSRDRKQRNSMITHLQHRADDVLMRRYYANFMQFARDNKARRRINRVVEAMKRSGELRLMRHAFSSGWMRFIQCRRGERERVKYSYFLAKAQASRTVSIFYNKWYRSLMRIKERRDQYKYSRALLSANIKATTNRAYCRWYAVTKLHRQARLRRRWIDSYNRCLIIQLRRQFYHRWVSFRNEKILLMRKPAELTEAQLKHDEIAKDYAAIAHRANRVKKIHQLRERLAKLKEENEQLSIDEKAIDEHNAALKNELMVKRATLIDPESPAAKRLELIATMAQIRSRALNYDADAVLIIKTLEKTKADPPGKFKSFFNEFKATLGSHLGSNAFSGSRWNLGSTNREIREAVLRLPVSARTMLLETLKKACACFDAFNALEVENFDFRDEIIENCETICTITETLTASHKKNSFKA